MTEREIEKTTVGIVGGTGSAKSSLVQLVPRLYDVSSGSLKVGGVGFVSFTGAVAGSRSIRRPMVDQPLVMTWPSTMRKRSTVGRSSIRTTFCSPLTS